MGKVIANEFRLPGNKLVYDQTNILGTVSQTAGEPTGAIIESDSNANGEYVRYADGTQVCWHRDATNRATNVNPTGSYWRTAGFTYTFPMAFVSTPVVSGTTHEATTDAVSALVRDVTATTCNVRGWGVNSAQSVQHGYIAVGRWF